MNRKTQLILLALEELKNASYSVERREECEELMREIEMSTFSVIGDNSDAGILRHWEKKTKRECAREILNCWRELEKLRRQKDKIISVSGFGVENTPYTQCNYMLTAVTEGGKVLLSTGDGVWADVSGND